MAQANKNATPTPASGYNRPADVPKVDGPISSELHGHDNDAVDQDIPLRGNKQ